MAIASTMSVTTDYKHDLYQYNVVALIKLFLKFVILIKITKIKKYSVAVYSVVGLGLDCKTFL